MSSETPEYTVKRMKRKTILLLLRKDGILEVRSPYGVSNRVLDEFIVNKKEWIRKAKERQAAAIVLPSYTDQDLEHMKDSVSKRIADFLDSYQGKIPVKIRIRKQKSVWGTCNSKGIITINAFCSLLPEPLFEYVMIHELCHLSEMNHSPRFWSLVTEYIPDWKVKRTHLKKFRIE